MFHPRSSPSEIARKNAELYDETSDAIWRLAVYEAVHEGWEFINLGGRQILDAFAQRAGLGRGKKVLELCSGQGAACQYLAERYACEVTGVEMNSRQVERARARLAQVEHDVAERIRFIEANVLHWRPSLHYDALLSLDSLMLIDQLSALLDKAYASLKPGRPLMVAVIVAGPYLDDELRRFAWELDGMISLPTLEEYAEMLKTAGFIRIDSEDLTQLALDSSVKIATALERNQEEIVRTQGKEAYWSWIGAGKIYVGGFREKKLTYQLISARRQALSDS